MPEAFDWRLSSAPCHMGLLDIAWGFIKPAGGAFHLGEGPDLLEGLSSD